MSERSWITSIVGVLGILLATSALLAQSEWIRTGKTDPFTNLSFTRFTLDGKFLQAPSKGGVDKPIFVVECDPSKTKWKGTVHGKVMRSFIIIGAVLDSQVSTRQGSLVSTTQNLVSVM